MQKILNCDPAFDVTAHATEDYLPSSKAAIALLSFGTQASVRPSANAVSSTS